MSIWTEEEVNDTLMQSPEPQVEILNPKVRTAPKEDFIELRRHLKQGSTSGVNS
jgi:hypothetical protein